MRLCLFYIDIIAYRLRDEAFKMLKLWVFYYIILPILKYFIVT